MRLVDLAGVFVFALSGASLAVRKEFDVVGMTVLALVTALGGGLARDVLLGDVPPPALRSQLYLLIPLGAVVVVAIGHRVVEQMRRPVLLFDAVGLGLYCASGAAKALDAQLGPAAAILLGTLSATGGGIVRDVLARDVPMVFRSDTVLYAIPAAVGAGMVVVADRFDVDRTPAVVVVAAAVCTLRLAALHFGWRAPGARRVGQVG